MKYTFEMALAFLKQGVPMRRAGWKENLNLRITGNRFALFRGDKLYCEGVCPTYDQILAEDWMKHRE